MIKVRWPQLPTWIDELSGLGLSPATIQLTVGDPGFLYEFLVRSADEILSLPSHSDYIRPERTARTIVRWSFGLHLVEQRRTAEIGLGGGLALAIGALRTPTIQTRLGVVVAAELAATATAGMLYIAGPDGDLSRVEATSSIRELVTDALREAELPSSFDVYASAWTLVTLWLNQTPTGTTPVEEDFAAWLAQHPEM
jgi:hypothetical protein